MSFVIFNSLLKSKERTRTARAHAHRPGTGWLFASDAQSVVAVGEEPHDGELREGLGVALGELPELLEQRGHEGVERLLRVHVPLAAWADVSLRAAGEAVRPRGAPEDLVQSARLFGGQRAVGLDDPVAPVAGERHGHARHEAEQADDVGGHVGLVEGQLDRWDTRLCELGGQGRVADFERVAA